MLLLLVSTIQAKEKYFVYFIDKGIDYRNSLKKNSAVYLSLLAELSDHAIERRTKAMGEDIISFEDLPLAKRYVEQVKSTGAEIVWELKWFNAVSCFMTDEQAEDVSKFSFVDRVEKVKTIKYSRDNKTYPYESLLKPNSTNSLYNYGPSLNQYELSDVPPVHDKNFNGENVIVALLDAGFLWENHPVFSNTDVIAEFDFVYNDEDVGNENDASHGTAVLSLIGGFADGSLVAPAFNASYILAKTEDIRSETHVEEDNFAAAMEWVESLGADIVSSSLGYNTFDQNEGSYTYDDMNGNTTIVTRAFEKAFDRGVVTITSAGNEGNKSWKYITAPADGKNTIAVGAVDPDGDLAAYSSRGPTSDGRLKPEVLAQGTSCYLADAYSGGYYVSTGTSYAAPIVAGVAAQLLSAHPHLNNRQIRSIVIQSGDNADNPDNDEGYGILSAKRAITFPNVEFVEGDIKVQKIILGDVEAESVFMCVYESNSDQENCIQMMNSFPNVHSVNLPTSNNGDTLYISFEWKDENGTQFDDPASGRYEYIYGSEFINSSEFDAPSDEVPDDFKLFQNYPNPFNGITRIKYAVSKKSIVKIKVFNILGEEVTTLLNQTRSEGIYDELAWDGRDRNGRFVSSGIYLYVLQAGDFLTSKKMVYLK